MSDYSLPGSTAVLNDVNRIIKVLLILNPLNKEREYFNNKITNLIEQDDSTLRPIFDKLKILNLEQLLEFQVLVETSMKVIRYLEKTITQNNLKMSQVDKQQQTKLQKENNKYESQIKELKTAFKHPEVYSGEVIQLIIQGESVPKEVIQAIIQGESVPEEVIQLIQLIIQGGPDLITSVLVLIEVLAGNTILEQPYLKLTLKLSDTVGDVKTMIQEQTRISVDKLHLISSGEELQPDTKKLYEFGLDLYKLKNTKGLIKLIFDLSSEDIRGLTDQLNLKVTGGGKRRRRGRREPTKSRKTKRTRKRRSLKRKSIKKRSRKKRTLKRRSRK